MKTWKKLFSKEDLDSSDIPEGGKAMITITKIGSALVDGNEGGKVSKMHITFTPSPTFARTCKKTTWIAPVTIAKCLDAMFGENIANWPGKRVVLHVEDVEAFGEETDAVRIFGSPDIAEPCYASVRKGKRRVKIRLEAVRLPTRAPADSDAAPPPDTAAAPADTTPTPGA